MADGRQTREISSTRRTVVDGCCGGVRGRGFGVIVGGVEGGGPAGCRSIGVAVAVPVTVAVAVAVAAAAAAAAAAVVVVDGATSRGC